MPANIVKIVDLGGRGDFSSLAAFIAWLYNNYNPLDRNACAICKVSSGNTYADTSTWGSLPSFSAYSAILITTTKDHWFNGIFSSTRYYLATNPTQPTYWYQLLFHRVQIGAPGSPITGTIKAGLFLCGIVSSASPVVNSDTVVSSMIICTTNNQVAVSCQNLVSAPLVARSLLLTRPGYTGNAGISAGGNGSLRVHGNHIVRFTTPINNGGNGYSYYNSTTASSISPNTGGNITNATPTFVDESNWNYILSINDTSAKDLYDGYQFGGVAVSLYHNGITGYRFPVSSIGPTDPDPGTYASWLTKVVNTNGGGDFTSLNAAFVWLYNNYPNLVTSNIRAKFVCKGSTADNTDVNTTISTTDPRHYIHVVADNDYRFRGVPNLAMLYKRSSITVSNGKHVILEGIQITQSDGLSGAFLIIDCYVSTGSNSWVWGNYINSIIILNTTSTTAAFGNSLVNCTVINTNSSNGVLPALGVSINCIVIGVVRNIGGIESFALGVATNYSSPLGNYCKYSQTITFRNPSQNDYRLSWNDTAAAQQGIYTGSYLEDVVDVEEQRRPITSSYGADDPVLLYTEFLYGSDATWQAKYFVDHLLGIDTLRLTTVVDRLYCVIENLYRSALSGRILIRVQKKTLRIHRI